MSRNAPSDVRAILRIHAARLHEELGLGGNDRVVQGRLEHMLYLLKTFLPQEIDPPL